MSKDEMIRFYLYWLVLLIEKQIGLSLDNFALLTRGEVENMGIDELLELLQSEKPPMIIKRPDVGFN